ncbi:unnamed protein product [Pleuronectes platessa]|uniref:Uncharacterized protein n=1 Tax=Pleuronectes platessa TaxID=8262 RepID=A0A9N7Z2W3_PLEPL|nr:unnamed protein product [Pleuronectes platessa]
MSHRAGEKDGVRVSQEWKLKKEQDRSDSRKKSGWEFQIQSKVAQIHRLIQVQEGMCPHTNVTGTNTRRRRRRRRNQWDKLFVSECETAPPSTGCSLRASWGMRLHRHAAQHTSH